MLRSHAEDAKVVFCYSARAVEMHHRMHEKTAEALMLMAEGSRCSGADPVLRQSVTAACSNDDECQPGLSCLCDDYKDYVRARRRALLFGNLPQPPIKYEIAAGASDKAVAGATGRAK